MHATSPRTSTKRAASLASTIWAPSERSVMSVLTSVPQGAVQADHPAVAASTIKSTSVEGLITTPTKND